MIGEFRTAKAWRIFIYIFSPLFIILFIYLGFMPFTRDEISWVEIIFWLPLSLGMIALFTYGLIDTVIGKFVIDRDQVSTISPWRRRQFLFSEIKGYCEDSNYLLIIPIDPRKKAIKVSLYTEKAQEIIAWFSTRFPELNSKEAQEGAEGILESIEFGFTHQSREYRLNEAKRICRLSNAVGFVLLAWVTFFPRPYVLSLSMILVYPIFILMLLYFYRGLIRLDEKTNSTYPSISTGFGMAAFGVLLRALLDYEILDYSNVWLATSAFSFLLFVFVMLTAKRLDMKEPESYLHLFAIVAMVCMYSFGSYIIANCTYDKSSPRMFESEVVGKEISSGKNPTYYLQVNPWEERTEIERIKVSEDEYYNTSIGKRIVIYQMAGLFGTPWLIIDASTEAQ